MNKKIAFTIEIVWLIVAVLSLFIGFYETNKNSLDESYIWFIITFIAFLMYTFRRYSRKYHNNKKQ